ncbi:MAG TPA: hydroxymethylglutaryl-CoA reductase, degradative [Euryarchaeota archaeon]|nr:hydroxymethylglutaryl-CoA reductase, degradative [Euryarchaeota archaeon]
MKSSRISGFYKLPPEERLEKVREFANLEEEEVKAIAGIGLNTEQAERMIENFIGTLELPIGIATNFLIDEKDYLVPMAIEEPSVLAAASNAAKMARVKGGFTTSATEPVMIGQIQLTGIHDPHSAKMEILRIKDKIIDKANEQDPILVKFGGGCKDIEVRVIDTKLGPMVITHLLVDCRDAMGANAINTMAEAVAPMLEDITGGKVYLRIISNLAKFRLARARAVFDKDAIGGEEVVDGILNAYAFAEADIFRCATHNKGIMNGITAVTLATGNDTRAIEAGAHSYAAINGSYKPLTTYEKNKDGDLVGTIEVPVAAGLIGGATAVHPVAKASVKILGIKTASELSRIIAAVGLAQNFAALRALATEGIQRGHMNLHARNIAAMAGAVGDEINKVAELLVRSGKVRMDKAKEILEKMRAEKKGE